VNETMTYENRKVFVSHMVEFIPAKAGIQAYIRLDSCFRRDDNEAASLAITGDAICSL